MKKKKLKSILYVEDEKLSQIDLADILEDFCDVLYTADDGKQGLILFKKYKPQVIISDIKMPFMNGIEMCREIRKLDKNIKIIFTTAFSDTSYFQEAIDLQVDGYILKPIEIDLLIKKIENIIEQINLEEELVKKDKLLIQQSKLASMGEMIGNIAHQWKQPLNIISMTTSDVLVHLDLNTPLNKDELREHCNNTMLQVEYLSKTIDDFRNFFKPNKPQMNYNLKEFFKNCLNLVNASFHDNMIETIEEIDDRINSFGHPEYLTQALINIFNNAKDAFDNAKDIQSKLVFVMIVKENNNEISIVIKDNAGGIPESIIDKIFDPYFTTKNNNGTGLGLYITHSIITESLNGLIYVENERFNYKGNEYKGAKFTIKLPTKVENERI